MQVGDDGGEFQDMCDTSKNGNNIPKEIARRKRPRSEKDGIDLRKKKK